MDDIVDLVSRSDDDLRALIAELEAEERDISRRRRILHGELDILRAELVMRLQRKHAKGEAVISADDVEGLSRSSPARAPPQNPSPSPPRATARTRRTSVFCPECGIRNSEGASFCVRCGASLIADQPESATTLSYMPGDEDGETTAFAACAEDACLVIRSGGGRAGETVRAQGRPCRHRAPSGRGHLPRRRHRLAQPRDGRPRRGRVGDRRRGQPQRHIRQSASRRSYRAHGRRRDPDRQVQLTFLAPRGPDERRGRT